MRFRPLVEEGDSCGGIYTHDTVARNPDTSETYEAVSVERSTSVVYPCDMQPGSSADAYVWMAIPEGVNAVDIFIPHTGAFKNVPITN
jgi:hypothetical protein